MSFWSSCGAAWHREPLVELKWRPSGEGTICMEVSVLFVFCSCCVLALLCVGARKPVYICKGLFSLYTLSLGSLYTLSHQPVYIVTFSSNYNCVVCLIVVFEVIWSECCVELENLICWKMQKAGKRSSDFWHHYLASRKDKQSNSRSRIG